MNPSRSAKIWQLRKLPFKSLAVLWVLHLHGIVMQQLHMAVISECMATLSCIFLLHGSTIKGTMQHIAFQQYLHVLYKVFQLTCAKSKKKQKRWCMLSLLNQHSIVHGPTGRVIIFFAMRPENLELSRNFGSSGKVRIVREIVKTLAKSEKKASASDAVVCNEAQESCIDVAALNNIARNFVKHDLFYSNIRTNFITLF